MEKYRPIHLQEIICSSQDAKISKQITKLLSAGVIRKIAPRVYSSNLDEPIEGIIRRNLFQILGNLYPGVILSHRSAFEFQPTKSGQLFLTSSYTKKVKLPGITLQFLEGASPIEGDNMFSGELYVSQKARAFLENLQSTKKLGSTSKCLSLPEIEERLEQIIRVNGEDELNKLRDQARAIAEQLKMHKEFEKLFDTEYQSVWDEKAGQCEFGAFYIEPMQGTGGYIVPPKGYMKKLAESLKKRNVLLVADEIQMGVYRTGKLWSWENFDIIPDIFVFGKAITNGLNPLSGIWAKEELINPQKFPPGSTHSTFASNPLGTSVALEVMKMTEEDDFGKKVNDRGAYFLKRIEELKSRWKVVGDVSGLGLALRIELCEKDGFTASRKLADRMFNEGLLGDIKIGDKTYGLVLDIGGYEKNVITLAPSLLISEEEIDLGIQLFEALLKRCGAE